MLDRYTDPVFKKLWSDENKFQTYLKVELASSLAHQKLGLFDEATYQKLTKASFNLERIYEIEKETKHDVIAFTQAVTETLGDEANWFHYGLTSNDVVDTAYALQIKEANTLIEKALIDFIKTLEKMAIQYKHTMTMGRTHGMHADITTFGLKFALYYDEFKRHLKRFRLARREIEVGKISGAVGNFAHIDPIVQKIALEELGLSEVAISTQVISRDIHAFYIQVISLIGSSIDKIATEIRHLSRTEVGEVQEAFSKNQKGSSAMPHKKNPVASENMSGIARVLRGFVVTANENINLWHERDISHSSAERIIIPDATSLIYYMLRRYDYTLSNLVVNEEKMRENIDLNYQAIFSQKLLKALLAKDLSRTKAYELVQGLTFKAFDLKQPLSQLLKDSKEINSILNKEEINEIFKLDGYLKFIDQIYQNVGIEA